MKLERVYQGAYNEQYSTQQGINNSAIINQSDAQKSWTEDKVISKSFTASWRACSFRGLDIVAYVVLSSVSEERESRLFAERAAASSSSPSGVLSPRRLRHGWSGEFNRHGRRQRHHDARARQLARFFWSSLLYRMYPREPVSPSNATDSGSSRFFTRRRFPAISLCVEMLHSGIRGFERIKGIEGIDGSRSFLGFPEERHNWELRALKLMIY